MSTVTDRDRQRMIAVCGQRVRVSVRPPAGALIDAPPLLLCNGIGAGLEALQPLVDALDPDRGVIRFDVPGVAESPLPAFPYPLAALASWVTAMVRRLGHREFDVLGFSWGGGLAQQLALQSGRRVRRVVLVATNTGSLMVPGDPWVVTKLMTPLQQSDAMNDGSIAARMYGGSLRTDPERGARLLHAVTPAGPVRGYYLQLAATAGWTSLPFLHLIGQPTLVLGGDDDPIIPLVNTRLLGTLIPQAQLHVYHGGHLAILTESDVLAPLIETFLARDGRRRP